MMPLLGQTMLLFGGAFVIGIAVASAIWRKP